MYTRLYPQQRSKPPAPPTSASCQNRKQFLRRLLSIQSVFFLVFLSFLCVGYWMGQTVIHKDSWLHWAVGSQDGKAPVAQADSPLQFQPYDYLTVGDVIDLRLLEVINSSRTVYYVFCSSHESIGYVQYLSLASVTRFFIPRHLVFLYENRPPFIETGRWTSQTEFQDLLRNCGPNGLVSLRMRNASLVCQDSRMMHEFVMKLLLQFGGLYVGRRTFMTEVAAYMTPVSIEDHILWHLTDDCEGFVYVRQPLSSHDSSVDNKTVLPVQPAGRTPRPTDGKNPQIKVKYISSRQLHCFESATVTHEVLETTQRGVLHACLVIPESVAIDPWSAIKMRSDFGRFVRKAIFNIYHEQEVQFFIKATNTSVTPALCTILF